MSRSTRTAASRGVLALRAVDLAALAAFVVVGVMTHDHGLPVASIARVGLPLAVAWMLATALVGTYRRLDVRTLLTAWALAVPPAVAIRTAIVGGPWGERFLSFLGVALAFTLLFLLVGRGAVLMVRSLVPAAG
jgi:hypothetical protein